MWFVILCLNRKSTQLGLKKHLPGVIEYMRMMEPLNQQKCVSNGRLEASSDRPGHVQRFLRHHQMLCRARNWEPHEKRLSSQIWSKTRSLFQRLIPEKQLSIMTVEDKVQCLFISMKVQK